MRNNILTFNEVLKQTNFDKRFLLLGNGFGLSTDNESEVVYRNKKDNNGQNVFYLQ